MDELLREALGEIAATSTVAILKDVEVRWLGKKGRLTSLLKELGGLPPEERKARGQALNALKQAIEEAVDIRRGEVTRAEAEARVRTAVAGAQAPGEADGGGLLVVLGVRSQPRLQPSRPLVGWPAAAECVDRRGHGLRHGHRD